MAIAACRSVDSWMSRAVESRRKSGDNGPTTACNWKNGWLSNMRLLVRIARNFRQKYNVSYYFTGRPTTDILLYIYICLLLPRDKMNHRTVSVWYAQHSNTIYDVEKKNNNNKSLQKQVKTKPHNQVWLISHGCTSVCYWYMCREQRYTVNTCDIWMN